MIGILNDQRTRTLEQRGMLYGCEEGKERNVANNSYLAFMSVDHEKFKKCDVNKYDEVEFSFV